MKGSSAGVAAPSSGSSKSGGSKTKGSSILEAQGKRIHHGIENGPIDIKGKFTNWPGMGNK